MIGEVEAFSVVRNLNLVVGEAICLRCTCPTPYCCVVAAHQAGVLDGFETGSVSSCIKPVTLGSDNREAASNPGSKTLRLTQGAQVE